MDRKEWQLRYCDLVRESERVRERERQRERVRERESKIRRHTNSSDWDIAVR